MIKLGVFVPVSTHANITALICFVNKTRQSGLMKASLNIKLDLSISISYGGCEASRICEGVWLLCIPSAVFVPQSQCRFPVDFLKKLGKQLFCLFAISREELSAYISKFIGLSSKSLCGISNVRAPNKIMLKRL